APTHCDRGAPWIVRRTQGRPDRVRECVDGEHLAADGGRLEERQPAQVLGNARRLGVDDAAPLHAETYERELVAARRISHQLEHRTQGTPESVRGAEAPLTVLRARRLSRPCEPGQARWVPCGPSASAAWTRRGLP